MTSCPDDRGVGAPPASGSFRALTRTYVEGRRITKSGRRRSSTTTTDTAGSRLGVLTHCWNESVVNRLRMNLNRVTRGEAPADILRAEDDAYRASHPAEAALFVCELSEGDTPQRALSMLRSEAPGLRTAFVVFDRERYCGDTGRGNFSRDEVQTHAILLCGDERQQPTQHRHRNDNKQYWWALQYALLHNDDGSFTLLKVRQRKNVDVVKRIFTTTCSGAPSGGGTQSPNIATHSCVLVYREFCHSDAPPADRVVTLQQTVKPLLPPHCWHEATREALAAMRPTPDIISSRHNNQIMSALLEDLRLVASGVLAAADRNTAMTEGKTTLLVEMALVDLVKTSRRVLNLSPRVDQLVGPLALLTRGVDLMEFRTGSGKTLVCAMTAAAAVLSKMYTRVFIVSTRSLAKKDFDTMQRLYLANNVSVGTLLSCADVDSGADVVYSTTHDLRSWMLRRPVGSAVFGDNSLLLLDEVDSELIDCLTHRTQLTSPVEGSDDLQEAAAMMMVIRSKVVEHLRETDDGIGGAAVWYIPVHDQLKARLELTADDPSYYVACRRMRYLLQHRLHTMLKSMQEAHDGQRLDHTYVHHRSRVVPIDFAHTGAVQSDMTLGQGVQLFLSFKDQKRVADERFVSVYASLPALMAKFRRVCGVSGTLGNEACEQFMLELIKRTTKKESIGSAMRMPTGSASLQLVAPMLVLSRTDVFTVAAQTVHELAVVQRRAVLVLTPTVEYGQQLEAFLRREQAECRLSPVANIKSFLRDDQDEIAVQVRAGDVILSTALLSRGADLQPTDEIIAAGGLHALDLFLGSSARVDEQKAGRVARNNAPGSYQMVLAVEDCAFVCQLDRAVLYTLLCTWHPSQHDCLLLEIKQRRDFKEAISLLVAQVVELGDIESADCIGEKCRAFVETVRGLPADEDTPSLPNAFAKEAQDLLGIQLELAAAYYREVHYGPEYVKLLEHLEPHPFCVNDMPDADHGIELCGRICEIEQALSCEELLWDMIVLGQREGLMDTTGVVAIDVAFWHRLSCATSRMVAVWASDGTVETYCCCCCVDEGGLPTSDCPIWVTKLVGSPQHTLNVPSIVRHEYADMDALRAPPPEVVVELLPRYGCIGGEASFKLLHPPPHQPKSCSRQCNLPSGSSVGDAVLLRRLQADLERHQRRHSVAPVSVSLEDALACARVLNDSRGFLVPPTCLQELIFHHVVSIESAEFERRTATASAGFPELCKAVWPYAKAYALALSSRASQDRKSIASARAGVIACLEEAQVNASLLVAPRMRTNALLQQLPSWQATASAPTAYSMQFDQDLLQLQRVHEACRTAALDAEKAHDCLQPHKYAVPRCQGDDDDAGDARELCCVGRKLSHLFYLSDAAPRATTFQALTYTSVALLQLSVGVTCGQYGVAFVGAKDLFALLRDGFSSDGIAQERYSDFALRAATETWGFAGLSGGAASVGKLLSEVASNKKAVVQEVARQVLKSVAVGKATDLFLSHVRTMCSGLPASVVSSLASDPQVRLQLARMNTLPQLAALRRKQLRENLRRTVHLSQLRGGAESCVNSLPMSDVNEGAADRAFQTFTEGFKELVPRRQTVQAALRTASRRLGVAADASGLAFDTYLAHTFYTDCASTARATLLASLTEGEDASLNGTGLLAAAVARFPLAEEVVRTYGIAFAEQVAHHFSLSRNLDPPPTVLTEEAIGSQSLQVAEFYRQAIGANSGHLIAALEQIALDFHKYFRDDDEFHRVLEDIGSDCKNTLDDLLGLLGCNGVAPLANVAVDQMFGMVIDAMQPHASASGASHQPQQESETASPARQRQLALRRGGSVEARPGAADGVRFCGTFGPRHALTGFGGETAPLSSAALISHESLAPSLQAALSAGTVSRSMPALHAARPGDLRMRLLHGGYLSAPILAQAQFVQMNTGNMRR